VVRLDAGSAALATTLGNFASSHAFNLAEAIELGRALGRLPPRLVIYGIEGACFEHGAAPSAAVRTAAVVVGERIRAEVEACTKHP
jgi:hydrogenase maturation protease